MATLSAREVVQAARQAGYQVATVERLRPSRWLLTLTDATGAEIVLLVQVRPLIISANVGHYKQTIPDPTKRSWKEKYTWGTTPRWDREPMESGPLPRQWISTRAGKLENEFIHVVDGGLEIDLPKGQTEATTLRWQIPAQPNALERNRARVYHVAYSGMVAYTFLLKAFEYVRHGRTAISARYRVPDEAIGFWEAGQRTLTHHVVVSSGRIADYQIVAPSTWMAAPRVPFGVPGPYEEAVLNTPLLEECDRPEDFSGIDILRTIRSFDPCILVQST